MYPGQHPGEKLAYQMASATGQGKRVTYAELEADSNRAANLFRHLGLTPGDGIAILLPNHHVYLKVTWGAQRSGLYYTPISILFQRDEIDYILANSDAKVLITTPVLMERISPGVLAAITVLVVTDGGPVPEGTDSFFEALAAQPASRVDDECEGAEMIYSSGTTGRPKGVRFKLDRAPLGTVSRLFETRVKLHGIDDSVRYLSTAPLYHSAPLRYNMMVTRLGGSATVMEKFDAEHALALIERERITHSQWVPTMFVRLLRLPDEIRNRYDTSSLRFVIHAAAPCPIDVKEKMIAWLGPILFEYYSGTEANGSTAITSAEWLTHKGSVGRAIHGEIHILDDDGNELPAGETGTVYFARGSDFSYYKDPGKTATAKTKDGWSTLGDVGHVDNEGYLYLTDRKSFMIISGGVNIYPQEIEDHLLSHPAVMDAAVIGVPNEEFGEEVKAVVELADPSIGSTALADELIQFCRDKLSHVKCPRTIEFDELPRHPTGKLYKRKLKDKYWNHQSTTGDADRPA